MGHVSVDFGTSNTVIARIHPATGQAETLEIPGVTQEMSYRPAPGEPEQRVHLLPSLIHYGAEETLIGRQVIARGLDESRQSFRWMKKGVLRPTTQQTPQGPKTAGMAATDLLTTALNYLGDRISPANDEFTFTVPVEAFEDFQDWMLGFAQGYGIRRVRILDEPTAAALGYQEALRPDDRFLMFDFGGGTLDVLIARIDLTERYERRTIQLGKAGRELGGMNIDRWIATDFLQRHQLAGADRALLLPRILRRAEQVKIDLSDPDAEEAALAVEHDQGDRVRVYRTRYLADCRHCLRGRVGEYADRDEACLGCLLQKEGFLRDVRQTLEEALERATMNVQFQRSHLTRAVVTGGSSLIRGVVPMLHEMFGEIVVCTRPFDAVARGAARNDDIGKVLAHDYAIESYDPDTDSFQFVPLFKVGQEYPTARPVRYRVLPSHSGMRRVEMKIYEVSRLKRAPDAADGARSATTVETDRQVIWLNSHTPTIVQIDPPFEPQRDQDRVSAEFQIDDNRRLLVTLRDERAAQPLLANHPVVKL